MGIFDSLFKSSSQCLQPSADGACNAAALSGAHPDFRLWSSLAQVTSRGLHRAHTHPQSLPTPRSGGNPLPPHNSAADPRSYARPQELRRVCGRKCMRAAGAEACPTAHLPLLGSACYRQRRLGRQGRLGSSKVTLCAHYTLVERWVAGRKPRRARPRRASTRCARSTCARCCCTTTATTRRGSSSCRRSRTCLCAPRRTSQVCARWVSSI
jgi:hypothetical protein